VGGAARVVATGSAHDREGRLRKNSSEVIEQLERLESKVTAHATEMAQCEVDRQAGAETVVLSYGTTARAAREAVNRLRARGQRVSFLKLMTLFPVPRAAIVDAAEHCRRVVVAEENLTGLYASVVEPLLCDRAVLRVNGIGRAITPARIVEAAGRPR
jgi:2-oxoglutarate ferredoxin oxidoreductase subunit alpha